MPPRTLNILCLILLIGGAIWSAILWHDGNLAKATLAAVWAFLAPTALRAVFTL